MPCNKRHCKQKRERGGKEKEIEGDVGVLLTANGERYPVIYKRKHKAKYKTTRRAARGLIANLMQCARGAQLRLAKNPGTPVGCLAFGADLPMAITTLAGLISYFDNAATGMHRPSWPARWLRVRLKNSAELALL